MRRLVGIVSVVVMAFVAAAPAVQAASSPTGMRAAKVKAARLSLEYPSSWLVLPVTAKSVAAEKKALEKKNPKIAALLDQVDVTQFKFRAIDLDSGGGSNVAVQLVEGQGSPGSLTDFRDAVVPSFQGTGGSVVDTAAVKVSGKRAYRADMTIPVKGPDGATITARTGVVALPEGDNTALVFAAARNDAPGIALINRILASVRRI
jgi:hypothetical protein